jgi:hypothetical protein
MAVAHRRLVRGGIVAEQNVGSGKVGFDSSMGLDMSSE